MEPLLALLLTFVLMWALLIRPQQRRMRQHQAVVASLQPGDEVVTAGGIYGVVSSVDDDSLMLEVAPELELKVLRAAISQRVSSSGTDGDGPDDVAEAGDGDELDEGVEEGDDGQRA